MVWRKGNCGNRLKFRVWISEHTELLKTLSYIKNEMYENGWNSRKITFICIILSNHMRNVWIKNAQKSLPDC